MTQPSAASISLSAVVIVGPVHTGAHVLQNGYAVVAVEGVKTGAEHAVVGVDATDDQRLDVEIAQEVLEIGVVEG